MQVMWGVKKKLVSLNYTLSPSNGTEYDTPSQRDTADYSETDDLVRQYLSEIFQIPLLTDDETIAICLRIIRGEESCYVLTNVSPSLHGSGELEQFIVWRDDLEA